MKREFPEEFSFFPQTFILPAEISELKAILKPGTESNELSKPKVHAKNGRYPKNYDPKTHSKVYRERDNQPSSMSTDIQTNTNTNTTNIQDNIPFFILKPDDWSRGKGIYLAQTVDDINLQLQSHMVAQKYLTNPLLIENLKFDLRIYVLLYGVNPMRIYVYEEGLARFATVPYEKPNQQNYNNMFMHLTNYAINKTAQNYISNENPDGSGKSHKRSLQEIYKII